MRSYQDERNFGLIVGGVFVALGSWWLFREKFQTIVPWVLALGTFMVDFRIGFSQAVGAA